MTIEYTTGCTADSIDIDGEDFRNLSAQKMQYLKDSLIEFLNNRYIKEDELQDLLIWVTERYGNTEFQHHCDQCHDDVFVTRLTI